MPIIAHVLMDLKATDGCAMMSMNARCEKTIAICMHSAQTVWVPSVARAVMDMRAMDGRELT